MYPYGLELFGFHLSIWNVTFLVGVLLGYPVLRATLRVRRPGPRPRLLLARWFATVYVSAVGAQLFAYLFDLETTLLPPPSVSPVRYYLDPLFGPKTLYGAIVFLPLTALAVSVPWRDLRYGDALDAWTPPLFTVLAVARVGCLLQGCCYGVRSSWFGIPFPPPRGHLYWGQIGAGLIEHGSWTQPVVPTQLIEAAGLCVLAWWAFDQVRSGGTRVFLPAVVLYSVLRFALEFVRADPGRNAFGPLSTSQWIALMIVTSYVLWQGVRRWRPGSTKSGRMLANGTAYRASAVN
jgi:phosphatidylglycerol:prolipoprotein diacylglycerol transferase